MPLLETRLNSIWNALDQVVEAYQPELTLQDIGIIQSIGEGIALVSGLPNVEADELLQFPGGRYGLVFNLDPESIGVVLLDATQGLQAGDEVYRTRRVLDVPVGESLIGRVVDGLGRPIDQRGEIASVTRWPIERDAPGIMDRLPVSSPLQTGIKVVDALVPIGRGQRELILGDRQTGKTAIAIDTILNQKDQGIICIYCSIGQRMTGVAKVIDELRRLGAMDYSIVVAATGDDPAGLQYVAPYAATSMGEYLMAQGRDVLIVYDDLSRHAWAYRELSLLLRRPPGREAFPGDIFYVHSRLLERSTHLSEEQGGGSLTALPIIETEEQNLSAYIPTNLISITDGQIYVSPRLFNLGILPAVDVGKSVSRVGGDAQYPAYRQALGDLRLNYAQFMEFEAFSRFGTRMDEEKRKTLEHGKRIRDVLKQAQFQPEPIENQIAVLAALSNGQFDDVPENAMAEAQQRVIEAMHSEGKPLIQTIHDGKKLDAENLQQLHTLIDTALQQWNRQDQSEEKHVAKGAGDSPGSTTNPAEPSTPKATESETADSGATSDLADSEAGDENA